MIVQHIIMTYEHNRLRIHQYAHFQVRINRYAFQSITVQRTEPANVIHESRRAGKFPGDFSTSIALLIRVCKLATSRRHPLAALSRSRRAAQTAWEKVEPEVEENVSERGTGWTRIWGVAMGNRVQGATGCKGAWNGQNATVEIHRRWEGNLWMSPRFVVSQSSDVK